MPPEVMTPIPQRQPSARVVERKVTDPTPLRQSLGSDGLPSPMASPEIMEEPLEDDGLIVAETDRHRIGARPSNGSLLPTVTRHHLSPSQVKASGSRSGIPPLRPPARSGTLPSPSTLVDAIPGKGELPLFQPAPFSRTSSKASIPSVNHSASNIGLSNLNPLRRHRSISGPGANGVIHHSHPNGLPYSAHRKGATPGSRLKLHTCTWNFDLQYSLRIPLGRPIPLATAVSISSVTGRSRIPAPILGAGPLSDSGIRLIVEQLPTPAATSAQAATGANKESLGSIVQAIHHADHGKGNPSELGKALKGFTDGEKTIFGVVDVDLAAFAGKGRTTRRFLLKGSKTNATIKVRGRRAG